MAKTTAVLALAAVALGLMLMSDSGLEAKDEFAAWKQEFGMNYGATEDNYRRVIFERNLVKINAHNGNGAETYKMGMTPLTALSTEEFQELYLTKFSQAELALGKESSAAMEPAAAENLKTNVDWVSYGAVSPVKTQSTACPASYAFSAVGAIEGISVIYSKITAEYSVQQLIDCSASYGNGGCQTGLMTNAFSYVSQLGIQTWAAYPYAGYLQTCKTTAGIYKISSFGAVSDCTTLASVLTTRPVSVAVDGSNFQNYKGGVFSSCGTQLSLATLLVGMSDTYWTLKNSWGTSWGEAGYIRLNGGNTCGVCTAGSYPNPL